jgi:hypothetical protein
MWNNFRAVICLLSVSPRCAWRASCAVSSPLMPTLEGHTSSASTTCAAGLGRPDHDAQQLRNLKPLAPGQVDALAVPSRTWCYACGETSSASCALASRAAASFAAGAYMSTYSWPDSSMIAYMISSVTERKMKRSSLIPS